MTSIYPSNLTILDGKDFCLYTPSTQTGNSEIQLCILCKDDGSIVHWKLSPAGGGLLITFNSEDLNITPGFLLELNVLLCSIQIPINGTASSWIDVKDLILQEIIKISYAVLSPLSAKEFLLENWGTKPSSSQSKISAPTEVSIRYSICSNQTDSGLQLKVQFLPGSDLNSSPRLNHLLTPFVLLASVQLDCNMFRERNLLGPISLLFAESSKDNLALILETNHKRFSEGLSVIYSLLPRHDHLQKKDASGFISKPRPADTVQAFFVNLQTEDDSFEPSSKKKKLSEVPSSGKILNQSNLFRAILVCFTKYPGQLLVHPNCQIPNLSCHVAVYQLPFKFFRIHKFY